MFCRNFPFAPAGIQAPERAGPVAMSQNTLALSQCTVCAIPQFMSIVQHGTSNPRVIITLWI